ncbi:MAG: hypothetical protein JWO49_1176 [Arthrobacter sp.]|nr:hypothetical protein [Arthrobacter sp.]MCU1548495.1 hypothetical protein [Arthrobacter sp.]
MSEIWPRLRPLCRRLALLGWASSAAGMAAGLAVAIASGTRISPMMSIMQLTAAVCMAVSVTAFVTAAALQPRTAAGPAAPPGDAGRRLESAPELPATVQSLLLGSLALLAGAVAFACAGLVLRSGPSAQSVAFCQVFLLGAAASGFTFMLFSKVSAGGRRS